MQQKIVLIMQITTGSHTGGLQTGGGGVLHTGGGSWHTGGG